MKAISLTQPWASALFVRQADGRILKGIETRSWCPPKYVKLPFRVAVHASKGFPGWAKDFAQSEFCRKTLGIPYDKLPLGSIIGYVTILGWRMTDDLTTQISETELNYGDYSPGRWGWMLTDQVLLDEPILCKGALGLWEVPAEFGLRG